MKVIYLNSHPIQYYSPLFKALNKELEEEFEVWYCSKHGHKGQGDKLFGAGIKW